ncbi:MAG: ECF transporter S component [Saccharofermentanales bacterium]|jgi:energy-coupling factor transport system substrate-specific component
MRKWSWLAIISLIAAMVICTLLRIEQTALFTFFAAVVAIIPFFISYEQKKPKPRDLMPVVVLSALAVGGRILFAALPNFKPTTAIVIITGMAFGPESGFMTGALSGLVSNLFFGQGPWTPWQMLAWGMIGFIAGILSEKNILVKPWSIFVYGILASFGFGLFMDTWNILGFVQPLNSKNILASYLLGVPFNISHALSTVIFLLPVYKTWLCQLKRIKLKFNLK